MDDYLVATLSASMASMGDLAGNDFRYSLTWPGRSAILGIVAAAIGIERDDVDRLSVIDKLSLAVGVHDEGKSLVDFHTVQTIPTAQVKNPATRGDALSLAGDGAVTTLTHREYRTGALFTFALWGEVDLLSIVEALKFPTFTMYLGRKSCPLSAPMAPRIISAVDPIAALRQAQLPPWQTQKLKTVLSDPHEKISGRKIVRNDVPRDRQAWTFSPRSIEVVSLGESA